MDSHRPLPPGQQLAAKGKWPIVGERAPGNTPDPWQVELVGEVEHSRTWTLESLREFDTVTRRFDIHCVTRWSRLDVEFTGVLLETLLDQVQPRPVASYISFQAASQRNHSTSLPLFDAVALGTMLVWEVDGEPLSPEHGGPLRSVVPERYFYKSLKWLVRMELLTEDRLGYWESEAGYHNRADPWKEERFVAGNVSRREMGEMIERRSFAGRELLGLQASGMDLAGLDARAAILRNADFSGSRLGGADFRQANLSNAKFSNADLAGADFRESDVEGADFSGADLRGADLRVPSLVGVTFVTPAGAAQVDSQTRVRRDALEYLSEDQRACLEDKAHVE